LTYLTHQSEKDGNQHFLPLYLPARTALVLKKQK
jgi:hypothetical protein